jgi:hypothetical protein
MIMMKIRSDRALEVSDHEYKRVVGELSRDRAIATRRAIVTTAYRRVSLPSYYQQGFLDVSYEWVTFTGETQ